MEALDPRPEAAPASDVAGGSAGLSSADRGETLGPTAETATSTSATGIAAAAGLITLGNAASRLLGLVRQQVIVALFGVTAATSAFATAATVPTMLYDLVIGGAVSAALIPVFSEYAGRAGAAGRAELGRVVGTVGVLAALVLAAASALGVLFAPTLVWVLVGDLDPAGQAETLLLVRVVLPSVVFLGLSAVATAALYARQEFVFPAFAVAFFNVGIIAGALLLTPALGILSLVLGVLIGAFLQLALQAVGMRRARLALGVDLRHPAVRRILALYAPVALGLVVSQMGVIVDRRLAWQTGPDSVAIMQTATTLVQLPLGLVATATSFAVLPRLSRHAAEPAGLPAYRLTLATGMRLSLLAMVPAAVALVLLRAPVFQLLFERGAFDSVATRVTAGAFLLYAPQLPFVAVDQLLIFAFYARRNTLTPMLVGLMGVGVYLASGLLLIGPAGLGLRGLVLANTLQNSLHAVVLLGLLWREVGGLAGLGIGRTLVRAAGAALPLGLICWAASGRLPTDRGPLTLLAALGVVAALASAAYVGTLVLLRTDEVGAGVVLVRRGLRRRA